MATGLRSLHARKDLGLGKELRWQGKEEVLWTMSKGSGRRSACRLQGLPWEEDACEATVAVPESLSRRKGVCRREWDAARKEAPRRGCERLGVRLASPRCRGESRRER